VENSSWLLPIDGWSLPSGVRRADDNRTARRVDINAGGVCVSIALLAPYFSCFFFAQSDFGRSSRYASSDAIDSDPLQNPGCGVERSDAFAAPSLMCRLT
jgi:hypothetical protein